MYCCFLFKLFSYFFCLLCALFCSSALSLSHRLVSVSQTALSLHCFSRQPATPIYTCSVSSVTAAATSHISPSLNKCSTITPRWSIVCFLTPCAVSFVPPLDSLPSCATYLQLSPIMEQNNWKYTPFICPSVCPCILCTDRQRKARVRLQLGTAD